MDMGNEIRTCKICGRDIVRSLSDSSSQEWMVVPSQSVDCPTMREGVGWLYCDLWDGYDEVKPGYPIIEHEPTDPFIELVKREAEHA